MADNLLPPFVEALLDPAIYEHPAGDVELVQTHISYVFIAGDYVYKFKKPVDFGFLDFSTLEKRQYCCDRELILNRRLCPDIYLGRVALTEIDGSFTLDGAGTVVEYGIKMVRMPEAQMMIRLINGGHLKSSHIDQIVERLVPFYAQAENSQEINQFGLAKGVAVNVLENFEQTEGFIGSDALSQEQFDAISSWSRAMLAREDLFAQRVAKGYVRDCHGDLYSANICLGDQVYIYDCIEFNDRFRYGDVACDVGFLAMDLDFHGLEQLSTYFIDQFIEKTGDEGLREILNFYKCYRAYVRGKISLFTASDPAVKEEVKLANLGSAKKYFQLAFEYVES